MSYWPCVLGLWVLPTTTAGISATYMSSDCHQQLSLNPYLYIYLDAEVQYSWYYLVGWIEGQKELWF